MSETTLWLISGIIFFCIEPITGTFAFLFFGFAALIVSGLTYFEMGSSGVHFLIFGILSAFSFIFVRKRLLRKNRDGFQSDQLNFLISSVDIDVDQMGTVTYQGSPWNAVNIGKEKILSGNRVQIAKTEGNKLLIEKKES